MSRLDGACTQLQGMHVSSSSYDMHLSSSSYVHTTLRSVYARPAGQGLSFSFFFRPPGVNLCSTLKGVQTSRRPRSTYHYGRSGHGGSAICRIYPGTFCFVFFSFLPFFFYWQRQLSDSSGHFFAKLLFTVPLYLYAE